MNANLRKVAGIAAMIVFFVALAINVKVTLDDPFAMVNEQALAEETTVNCPKGLWYETKCFCTGTNRLLGYSNNCGPSETANCCDNDCSAYDPSLCEDPI